MLILHQFFQDQQIHIQMFFDLFPYFLTFIIIACLLYLCFGHHKLFQKNQDKMSEYIVNRQDQRIIENYIRYGQTEHGFDLIRKNIIHQDEVILNNLLKNFIKQKNIERVRQIYQIMKDSSDCSLNIFNYNNILHSAIECDDFDFFLTVFKDIPNEQKDVVTFSTFIKGLLKKNRVKEVQELYSQIKQKMHLKLDVVFYNTLIDGLNKIKAFNYAYEILEDFVQDNNIQNFNNEYTISIIVQLLANLKKFDQAETFAKQLEDKSLVVNTCLMKSYFRLQQYEKIVDLCQKSQNLTKDHLFYSTAIFGFLKIEKYRKFCFSLLKESMARDIVLRSDLQHEIFTELINVQPQFQKILHETFRFVQRHEIKINDNLIRDITKLLQKK